MKYYLEIYLTRERIEIINQSNNFKRIIRKILIFYICINYIISLVLDYK